MLRVRGQRHSERERHPNGEGPRGLGSHGGAIALEWGLFQPALRGERWTRETCSSTDYSLAAPLTPTTSIISRRSRRST